MREIILIALLFLGILALLTVITETLGKNRDSAFKEFETLYHKLFELHDYTSLKSDKRRMLEISIKYPEISAQYPRLFHVPVGETFKDKLDRLGTN